jgi:hypothetical protein
VWDRNAWRRYLPLLLDRNDLLRNVEALDRKDMGSWTASHLDRNTGDAGVPALQDRNSGNVSVTAAPDRNATEYRKRCGAGSKSQQRLMAVSALDRNLGRGG